MLAPRPLAAALLVPALVAGCAGPFIRPDDRKEACNVAVDEKFGSVTFVPNNLSGPAGTLSGAGVGALQGLASGGGIGVLFTLPLGLILGAGYGTVCAVASAEHPTADADFERFLHEADTGALRRALQARLESSPRPECATATARGAAPDAVVHLDRIEARMACLHGVQEFEVVVKWRTVNLASGRVLNESETRRNHKSSRDVGDWFAHPEAARSEIEDVLALAGQDIAGQFVGGAPTN